MTDAEIDELFERSHARADVACDEYHAHSAAAGCLVPMVYRGGDERDVTILRLVEEIRRERAAIRAAASAVARDGREAPP